MKLNMQNFFVFLMLLAGIDYAAAQGTAFTYQGRLNDNGAPANGNYDLRFILFNVQEFGFPVGPILTNANLAVSNGIFTTTLDFGNGVFTGTNYWLEISVRANGGGAFNTLLPRQSITPTPYATFAASAATADNVAGQISTSQLNGTLGNAQLSNSSITVNAGTGLSGGGAVALGDSVTLTNAGVLSVTGNSDITATTTDGAVSLSVNAQTYNYGNTIVRRDFGGQIYAGSIVLPSASQGTPAIYSGSYPVFLCDSKGNSLIGSSAGEFLTTGQNNIANGPQALRKTTTGSANIAIGAYALSANTNGSDNIGIGQATLSSLTSGDYNVGIGNQVLYLTTNNYNTAVGYSALHENVSGQRNIALGYMAGYNVTGSDNICIGNNGTAGNERTIRIGSNQTNTFIAGVRTTTISGGTAVYISASGQLGVMSSSARFKENIQDMNDASDALLSLRPVTFRYKPEIDPAGIPQFGLIAEEVNKVNPDLVVRDENGEVYTVRYEAINAMLLNEFLKQHRTVEQQNAEIQTLKAKSDALETRMAELEQAMKSLAEK